MTWFIVTPFTTVQLKRIQLTKIPLGFIAAFSAVGALVACDQPPNRNSSGEQVNQITELSSSDSSNPSTDLSNNQLENQPEELTDQIPEIPGSADIPESETIPPDLSLGMPLTPVSTEQGTIVAIASGDGSFSTLLAALQVTGLADTLSQSGPYTVFAPTDEAFAALPPATLRTLMQPESKAQLTKVLASHMVLGKVIAADMQSGVLETVAGTSLSIQADDARELITVEDARIIQADIAGSNGVIHVVDSVILPPQASVE
ncbi:MAG: fasciclin domain-containing protein [Microcoleaceae cyanobacterium]